MYVLFIPFNCSVSSSTPTTLILDVYIYVAMHGHDAETFRYIERNEVKQFMEVFADLTILVSYGQTTRASSIGEKCPHEKGFGLKVCAC